jgi:hypothetical protein
MFHCESKGETLMLALAIVALWTVLACSYLVWQQFSGDLH